MGLDLNTALISDTFDGLIKTQDGNVLTSSPLIVTDGRGNNSSLALATAGNGAAITGTFTVDGVNILSGLTTAQGDITAIETKTDFITVTGAVNLDTIKTKADFITVTQAVDLDTVESDILSAKTKTDFITVSQAVDLDTMESDILSAKTKTDFITIGQPVNLDNVESGLATAEADIIAIEAKTDFITISQAVNLDTVEANAAAAKTKTDFLTVTQPVNLDTLESDVNTAKGDITAIEAKTDNITVTQAVNLDTMESDLAASKAKTDFITVTQAVNLDTIESGLAQAQTDINLIEGKTDFITITQPVDLDTVEANTATALANANSAKAKTDFITVTQAVDLDAIESGLSQAQTDINLIEVKTNNITVTQAVNLDTMESDIAVNNAKNSYPAADATKVGFISITQPVNLDSIETDVANLTANKYDKTGGAISGSVTIGGDLTVNGTTTTINTETLSVEDPLIQLANQNSANTIDTGFFADYSLDAGVTTKYAGLFKDASDSDKFKLFKGLEVEPTTTVNTSGTGYAKGDLVIGDLNADSGTIGGALSVSGNLAVDTNTLYVDAANNRVGIGTSSPTYNFVVSNNGAEGFEFIPAFGSNINVIQNYNRSTATWGTLDLRANDFIFRNQGSEALRIDSSGNVGIGISNPDSYDTNADNLVIGSTGASDKNGITIVGGDTDGRSAVYFADTTQNSAGYITYFHSNNSMLFGTTDQLRMTIDSSGNVGIGNIQASSINSASGLGNLVVGNGGGSSQGITVYTNSTTYGAINFADATSGGGAYAGYISFDHPTDSFGVFTGNVKRVRIDADGLKFGSDTAAANALDDYEEGTWTPVFKGTTTDGSYTYGIGGGKYTKIGNMVTVWCSLVDVTESSAGSGDIAISGLPFAIGSSNVNSRISSACYIRQSAVSRSNIIVASSENQSTVYPLYNNGGVDTNYTIAADFAAGMDIGFTFTYSTN